MEPEKQPSSADLAPSSKSKPALSEPTKSKAKLIASSTALEPPPAATNDSDSSSPQRPSTIIAPVPSAELQPETSFRNVSATRPPRVDGATSSTRVASESTPTGPERDGSLQSWAEARQASSEGEKTATAIQDEDSPDRFATTSNVNIHESVNATPSQQKMPAASVQNSNMSLAGQTPPVVVQSTISTAHPPAITLQQSKQSTASLPHPTCSTASMGSSLHVGGHPKLTPSSFQPLILQTTSTDNFAPYTPRGNLSIAMGEPIEISYEPIKYTPSSLAITGGMKENLKRFTAAAVKGSATPGAGAKRTSKPQQQQQQQQLQQPQSTMPKSTASKPSSTNKPQNPPVQKKTDNATKSPNAAKTLSTDKKKNEPSSVVPPQKVPVVRPQSTMPSRTAGTAPRPPAKPSSTMTIPQQNAVQKKPDGASRSPAAVRKPSSSVPPQKSPASRSQPRKQSIVPFPKSKRSAPAATPAPGSVPRSKTTTPHKAKPPKKLNSIANTDKSGKRSAPLSSKSSSAASKKSGADGKATAPQSPPGAAQSLSKSSLSQSRKSPRLSKHVHGEHTAHKYRKLSIDEAAMAAGEGPITKTENRRLSVTIKPGQKYDLIVPPENASPPVAAVKEHQHDRHCNHTKKRIRLTDEQKLSSQEKQRTSGGQPLVVPPLTRCQSGESEGGRRSVNKLYHFPSFSGRSSADCEYIEVIGAARPPIETPLTQAIFDNPEHARLIDQIDKLTGGPHNYRNERCLEDMYGLRVKKFWDRYQLHGTAYLDHLRKDPKYSEMPPSVRRTVKELHANNEHLCQHLYYIKSAACSPYIDNRLPHKFGERINVDAAYRAKAWRKRTELNYKLYQNILRTRPFCIDAEECLRESLRRLSWQIFIAKQPKTIKHCKQRLEYNTKCLLDPNYDRNGPPWWRPLSGLEQRILSEILEAQKTDDDAGVCKALQRFDIHFEQYHLQEALDMCNYGRGATSVGDVGDPLELLYYLRMTPPVRDGPYRLRTFFFVGIVRNTPQAQITDVREIMKHFFNWRQAIAEMHKIRRDLAGEPKWPKLVFERLRNIRDAMKIHPGSPYSHINIRWLMYNNKIARQYVEPGPFHIKDNLREFQQWAAGKHYIITKLPDFGRLPQFSKYYTKALEKFRPPERVFLDNR